MGSLTIAVKITGAVAPFIPARGFLGPCSALGAEVVVALGTDGV